MSEGDTGKSAAGLNSQISSTVNTLLDTLLIEKDENVRIAVESGLIRVAEKYPNEGLAIISTFRHENEKLTDFQIAILLRVIQAVTESEANRLNVDTIQNIVDVSLSEIIKGNDQIPVIQTPGVAILNALGRAKCSTVMEKLISKLDSGTVGHFMILNSIGSLAIIKIDESITYFKQIFGTILPTLGMIRNDQSKQSYAYCIGKMCEAVSEYQSQLHNTSENKEIEDYSTEVSVAYDLIVSHWLSNRDPKFCGIILSALTSMYPLLSIEKMNEQLPKITPQVLSLYRRSIDRNAITQLLGSILKTSFKEVPQVLDPFSDILITTLFDLVCVNPDYDKPQTVKGHFEVLRCMQMLCEKYPSKMIDMLLVQLRNNNERDRIKALLVISHLTNNCEKIIGDNINEITTVVLQMIGHEKSLKTKMILLKTIVAFAQKSFVKNRELIRFILRHCCRHSKPNLEHGTAEEYSDFLQACNNSMFILATTVGTLDNLLIIEMLQRLFEVDYVDSYGTIYRCLATLFTKNSEISKEGLNDDDFASIPKPVAVYVRSLTLLGNVAEKDRGLYILNFLQNYYPMLNKHLQPLWKDRIPELRESIETFDVFLENLYQFLTATIKDIDDPNFARDVVHTLSDQMVLYPYTVHSNDYVIAQLSTERCMLLKLLGVSLCYITDPQTIESKMDMIINTAKLEKLNKHTPHEEFESKLTDAAQALGFISRVHLDIILKRLSTLAHSEGIKKSTSGFFSNLIKDSQKETDMYKITLLVIESYGFLVKYANQEHILDSVNEMIQYNYKQLIDTKDYVLKKLILSTLLKISQQILKSKNLDEISIPNRMDIVSYILNMDLSAHNLSLLPIILHLTTNLTRIDENDEIELNDLLELACRRFFTNAQHLKTKFESTEDDERNSYLAKYLNLSLPQLNLLLKAVFEKNPMPSCLDDLNAIMEVWMKDTNSEVRICAGHVMYNALEVYIKTVKIGCEAPSKFNQTGNMLGKIVPRCIDSNATVRQTSINILKKILEISCIYETLTIADDKLMWMNDLQKVHDDITTDDPKEIYRLAGEIARIICIRLSNFQYIHFCKTLLYSLNDPESSSAIGASVVLKFFIQLKGNELGHSVKDIIKESLYAISFCNNSQAKAGVLKALLALTKHHPIEAGKDMLSQPLPLDENVIEFWQIVTTDVDLSGIIIDNYLQVIVTSCLYEGSGDEEHRIATVQPFSAFCVFKEMFGRSNIKQVLRDRFPEIFAMLLTSLATYTNLAPPMSPNKAINPKSSSSQQSSIKSKFGFIPNRDSIKLNPCEIVLDTFQTYLNTLEMEQISVVLGVCTKLSTNSNLGDLIDILTPMAVGVVNQLGVNSRDMKDLVEALKKYSSGPYDSHRIAAIGLYSQIVPLKPCGEVSNMILSALKNGLLDPNSIVRGFCIRGLAFVGNLNDHDVHEYSEISLTALLSGIDDYNTDCLIDIPLESMRGLSRLLKSLPPKKVGSFQISLAIRIRPFFENRSNEIREAALMLFGDLCQLNPFEADNKDPNIPDALKEQIFTNIFCLLLHLSESDGMIIRACKITLRKVCLLLKTPKLNAMIQNHLIDHGQLHYDIFITDLIKIVAEELNDQVPDFVDSCIPFLKSYWPEIRANAAIVIGLLYSLGKVNRPNDNAGHKVAILLKDEEQTVRIKAATALGIMFGTSKVCY